MQKQYTALCEKHKAEQEAMEELLNAREDAYLDLLQIPAAVVPRHTPAPSTAAAPSMLGNSPSGTHGNGYSPRSSAPPAQGRANIHESPRAGTEAARPRSSGLFGLGGFF